jgi:hypothetical protein
MTFKRFYIATLMGVLAGVVCVLLASSEGPLPMKLVASIFTGRVLIGFVIGISALKLPWALHGIGMGLVVGIPGALGAMMSATPEFGKWEMLAMSLVMGMIYGFVIELVTTVIFKAKQRKA